MPQFRKVQPGDPLRIPADDYNAAMDAARAALERRTGAGALQSTPDATFCLIRNSTGADVGQFSVLGLGDVLIAPTLNELEFKRKIAFDGVLPSATDHAGGRFAITLNPIRDGEIGRALVRGNLVKIQAPGDADPATITAATLDDGDETHLIANPAGAVQVLWIEPAVDPPADPPETPSDRWAIVRLGEGGDRTVLVRVEDARYFVDGTTPVTGQYTGTLFYPSGTSIVGPGADAIIINYGESGYTNEVESGSYIGQIVGVEVVDPLYDPAEAGRVQVGINVPTSGRTYLGRVMVDWDPAVRNNWVFVKPGYTKLADGVDTNPDELPYAGANFVKGVKVILRRAQLVGDDTTHAEAADSDRRPGLENLSLTRNALVAYTLRGPSFGWTREHIDDDTSPYRQVGQALPFTVHQLFLKIDSDYDNTSKPNFVMGKLCLQDGTLLGDDLPSVKCWLTTPTGTAGVYADLLAGDIILVDGSGPGDDVFAVDAQTSSGKVAVNVDDTLGFLEDQLLGDGEGMSGDDVWIGMSNDTGPDGTYVRRTHHLVGNSAEDDRFDACAIGVSGDDVTITPKQIILDATEHVIGYEDGTPVTFSLVGGLEVVGDEVWITVLDTSDMSHPNRLEVDHLPADPINETSSTEVIEVGFGSTSPSDGTIYWATFDVGLDAGGHVTTLATREDGGIRLKGDETWTRITNPGTGDPCVIEHMDPDSTTDYTYIPIDSDGFLVNGSGDDWSIDIPFFNATFDGKGHLQKDTSGDMTTASLALVKVTNVVAMGYGSPGSADTFWFQTQDQWVLRAGSVSGYTAVFTGDADCP